jgi:transposase, IS30 family
LYEKGYAIADIARVLKRSKSGIWYELQKKPKRKKYEASVAKQMTYVRMRKQRVIGKKIATHKELRAFIERHLLDDQSPEEISKRLRRVEKDLPYVSASAIRRYIRSPYGRKIEARREQIFGKKRRAGGRKRRIEGKRNIRERPTRIDKRHGLGNTEGDFIVSGKSGKGLVLGLRDRKVRINFLEKIFPVSVRAVERALVRIKKRFPELTTITFDNDILFLEHKRLEKVLGIKIYFCDEHSPWQKPGIENLNKKLRRYIPKSSDISKYSRTYIRKLEEKTNRHYMDCLNSLSPFEAYFIARQEKISRGARRKRNG